MTSPHPLSSSPDGQQLPHDEHKRKYSWLSLLLMFHLIAALICSTSNFSPSVLQSRLLRLLRPYSQTLAIDWDFTPFYLTHGEAMDRDCIVEVLPQGSVHWQAWSPAPHWNPEARLRWQRYVRFWAFHAASGQHLIVAEMTRALALYYRHSEGTIPQRIRLRRRQSVAWQTAAGLDPTAPSDPRAPSYYETLYEAIVIVDSRQFIHIVSIDAQARPAPPFSEVPP